MTWALRQPYTGRGRGRKAQPVNAPMLQLLRAKGERKGAEENKGPSSSAAATAPPPPPSLPRLSLLGQLGTASAEIFYKFNNEGRRLYEKRGEEVKKLRRKEKKKIDEKQEEEQSSGSLGPNSEGSSEFQLQNQMGSAKGKPIVEKRGSKKREENLNNKDA
ncbi:uncharacterized protein LOC144586546 isoform X1 [Pogona vitticeps]